MHNSKYKTCWPKTTFKFDHQTNYFNVSPRVYDIK